MPASWLWECDKCGASLKVRVTTSLGYDKPLKMQIPVRRVNRAWEAQVRGGTGWFDCGREGTVLCQACYEKYREAVTSATEEALG